MDKKQRFVDSKCDRCGKATKAMQNGVSDLFVLPHEWGAPLAGEGAFCSDCVALPKDNWLEWFESKSCKSKSNRVWKVLARHKWVVGAVITESYRIDTDDSYHRFTATIRGWRGWRLWQGATAYNDMKPRLVEIIERVKEIRERIDAGDESVFEEAGAW